MISVRPVSNFSSDILGTWGHQQALKIFFFIVPEITLLHGNFLIALGQA